jgi:hypothetical protein
MIGLLNLNLNLNQKLVLSEFIFHLGFVMSCRFTRYFSNRLANGMRKKRWDRGISKISPETSFSEKFLTF